MQPLPCDFEPALDVPAKSLDRAFAIDRDAFAFEHALLRRRHVIPPLQAFEPIAMQIRQRNGESTAAARRFGFSEREVLFECARQFD